MSSRRRDSLDAENVALETKTKLRNIRVTMEKLKKRCAEGFPEKDKALVQEACDDISRICNFLREIKDSERWTMLKLCMFTKKYVEDFCFSGTNCDKVRSYKEIKTRGFLPHLYTYIERVGVVYYYFGTYAYVDSLVIGFDLKDPKMNNEESKRSAGLRLAFNLGRKSNLESDDDFKNALLDAQNKIENAKFLRRLNEECCVDAVRRVGTESEQRHMKARFALGMFLDILVTLTSTARKVDETDESESAPSLKSIPSAPSNNSKKRVAKHLRRRK